MSEVAFRTPEEKRAVIRSQLRELGGARTVCLTCGQCGRQRGLVFMFRCFECGIWFCDHCGPSHWPEAATNRQNYSNQVDLPPPVAHSDQEIREIQLAAGSEVIDEVVAYIGRYADDMDRTGEDSRHMRTVAHTIQGMDPKDFEGDRGVGRDPHAGEALGAARAAVVDEHIRTAYRVRG